MTRLRDDLRAAGVELQTSGTDLDLLHGMASHLLDDPHYLDASPDVLGAFDRYASSIISGTKLDAFGKVLSYTGPELTGRPISPDMLRRVRAANRAASRS